MPGWDTCAIYGICSYAKLARLLWAVHSGSMVPLAVAFLRQALHCFTWSSSGFCFSLMLRAERFAHCSHRPRLGDVQHQTAHNGQGTSDASMPPLLAPERSHNNDISTFAHPIRQVSKPLLRAPLFCFLGRVSKVELSSTHSQGNATMHEMSKARDVHNPESLRKGTWLLEGTGSAGTAFVEVRTSQLYLII